MLYELINERKNKSALIQVLNNRGIYDIEHYLTTTDDDILNPILIKNIEAGAKMLAQHIAQGSKVMVQVDSDCDGYTSAALLLNYLNKLFPSFVQNNISYRLHDDKAHGLILETIPSDISLVIAPDSSSADYEVHKSLHDRGIDVLVIDHHEAEKISEYACVINNQLCDYPTKSLSGVGMVYKFCCYLDNIMKVNYANDFIDLVSLGCIADMMDMRDYETKHLAQKGLNSIQNPFYKAMIAKNEFSIGTELTPFAVSFYIAPYINAVTRSGTLDEKMLIFEAMLEYKCYEQILSNKRGHKVGEKESRLEQAVRNCVNIKNRQTKSRDEMMEKVETLISKYSLLDNKVLFIKLEKGAAGGLAGLTANQLMGIYQRPIAILSPRMHEDGLWWEGSFRGPNIIGLESMQEFFAASGMDLMLAGHANAGGLGVRDADFDQLLSYCNEQLKDFDFTPSHKVDFIYQYKELLDYKIDFYELMEYKHLWAQEVDQPKITIENVILNKDNLELLKGKVLKITPAHFPQFTFIKKNSNQEEYESLYKKEGYIKINLIGYCERNSYNNEPQIIIKDYEIIEQFDYYF